MSAAHARREFIKSSAFAGVAWLATGLPAGFAAEPKGRAGRRTVGETGGGDDGLGLLDVTRAPYAADPTGVRDSTTAIQDAVNDARDRQLVCFFPSGTYLISEMISCEVRVEKQERPRFTEYTRMSYWPKRESHYLLGSTRGPRPVLKLAPNAAGFDDPTRPKCAVKIWAQTWGDFPGQGEPIFGWEQPNISFGNVFRGIDIDVRGHPGAIGLRHTGSQGSYLMDCKVYAEGAYAGFNNCPGQGGGTYHIEAEGGRYGLLAEPACRFPMVAASVFHGQTVAPVAYTSTGVPMVLVGCVLESRSDTGIDLGRIRSFTGISLIDCRIELARRGPLFRAASPQNVFLENVHVKGADVVQTGGQVIPAPDRWMAIRRLSACSRRSENLINGVKSNDMFVEWSPATAAPDASALRAKHWRRLPSFEDTDAINIRAHGAVGDGEQDDTPALQAALRAGRKIFFPPGQYRIAQRIELPPEAELFGTRGASLDIPSLTTHDSVADATLLAFVSINGELEWRAGRGVIAFASGRLRVTPNGGGRFYAMRGIGGGGRAGAAVDDVLFQDTQQPISLYTLNIERRQTNPQAAIRNARHVRIYFFKCEASEEGYVGRARVEGSGRTPLAFVDCQDVRLYCANGNVVTSLRRAMIDIVNCRDVMVSQAASFNTGDFPQIRETLGGQSFEISSDRVAALFVRD